MNCPLCSNEMSADIFLFYMCAGCDASISTGLNKNSLMSYHIPIDIFVLQAYIEPNGASTFVEESNVIIASIDKFMDPKELSLNGFKDVMKFVFKHEKLKNFK